MVRLNVNIVIVTMVNYTAIPHTNITTAEECVHPEAAVTEVTQKDGEFVWDEKIQSLASVSFTETESNEIADALKQLKNNEVDTLNSPEAEPMRANLTQIERIPAMCIITPSITPLPSDEDFHDVAGTARNGGTSLESHIQSAFLQQVAANDVRPSAVSRTPVNVADLPAAIPASAESTPIVIKASIVKCPTDQELVALSQLPTADSETLSLQPFSSAGSSESSRSSSLERKKRGTRVTLDSDGKVVLRLLEEEKGPSWTLQVR